MENEIVNSQNDLLIKLDNFEESLELLNILNEKYDNLKKDLKKAMVKIGIENNLEQLKWITPKGTKITCSIGHPAEFKKQIVNEFDLNYLKQNYPDIYEKCCINKEISVATKTATSDSIRITFPNTKNKI